MKTLWILLVVNLYSLSSFYSSSQLEKNKFLGTWEWKSTSEVFRITLKRDSNFKGPDGKTYDVIVGRHIYSKNGKVVQESFSQNDKKIILFGVPSTKEIMQLSFVDLTLDKSGKATLTLLSNKSDKLHWKLNNPMEVITINRERPYSEGFTVPTDVLFTRVDN